MIRKKLSQVFGALRKGYNVDTKLGGFPVMQAISNVPVASATAVHAGIPLTGATQVVSSGLTDPSVYRALTVTGNQASVYGNVTIFGRDWSGQTFSETVLASGVSTTITNRAFRDVISVSVPVLVSGGDAISIGTANKLGLYRPPVSATALLVEQKQQADPAYAVVSAVSYTISTDYDTITIANNGADSYKVSYLTDLF